MPRPLKPLGLVLLALALALGTWSRFHELGSRQLAEDEYYFIRSVQFIQETGVPRFPEGGYYFRGLPFQYLCAASAKLLGSSDFAYRLPMALTSLAAAVFGFFYARRHLGPWGGGTVAAILLLSSWEVEFARFARMYSPFQAVTLLWLLALPLLEHESWNRRLILWATVLLATVTHELGLVLLGATTIYALALHLRTRRLALADLAGWAVAAAVVVFFVLDPLNYSDRGGENAVPGLQVPPHPRFVLPTSAVLSGLMAPVHLLGVCAVLAVLALPSLRLDKQPERAALGLAAIGLAFAALHQAAAFALILTVLFLRYRIWRWADHRKATYAMLGLAVVLLISWLALRYTQTPADRLIATVRHEFFGWPDLFRGFLGPWLSYAPAFTLIFVTAIAISLLAAAMCDPVEICRSPILVILCFILFVSVVNPQQANTRYSFFLYPSLLVTIGLGLVHLAKLWAPDPKGFPAAIPALGLAAVFAFSPDFNPGHLVKPTSFEANFRVGTFARHESHWYPRNDFKSGAEFLNTTVRPGEFVLVSGRELPLPHYLAVDHQMYYPLWNANLRQISRKHGTVMKWSGAPIISTEAALRAATRDVATVWIARRRMSGIMPRDFDIHAVWEDRLERIEQAYVAPDQHIEILKVSLITARTESS